MITIVYASDLNGVIGANGTLPWHLPSDLKAFKRLTEGHTVLMGRATYDSLPEHVRPLPGRVNIVLTRNTNRDFPKDVQVIHDLKDFLLTWPEDKKLYVIGGASVFNEAIHYAVSVIHTRIFERYEGDTYFNIRNYHDFSRVISKICDFPEDEGVKYSQDSYRRILPDR